MTPLSPWFRRKPTHTDQYLHWDSHHSTTNKYSIYTSLSHRAQYVCSNQQLSKQDSTDAVIPIGCSTDSKPNWNSNLVKNNDTTAQTYTGTTTEMINTFVVIPYSKGLSKSFRNICGKAGVQIHFEGANTVKELLVIPKNKDNIIQKGEVIYRYRCDQSGCNMEI